MNNLRHFLYLGGAAAVFFLAMGGMALAVSDPAPEMDPGTVASGLALLTGAVMLLREAYRRR